MKKPIKAFILLMTVIVIAILAYVGYRIYQESQVETVAQDESLIESTDKFEIKQIDKNNPESSALANGTFTRADSDHSGSGTAQIKIINDKPVIVFSDDFSVTSGPDLQVYLSKNKVASGQELGEFVSLGELKNETGTQSYNLPKEYTDYQSVVIWCRAFTTEFSSADLQ